MLKETNILRLNQCGVLFENPVRGPTIDFPIQITSPDILETIITGTATDYNEETHEFTFSATVPIGGLPVGTNCWRIEIVPQITCGCSFSANYVSNIPIVLNPTENMFTEEILGKSSNPANKNCFSYGKCPKDFRPKWT